MNESLDDAIQKVVLCTDGWTRRLRSYNDRLGYYDVPIGEGQWQELPGTRIAICKELFIGGIAKSESGEFSVGKEKR